MFDRPVNEHGCDVMPFNHEPERVERPHFGNCCEIKWLREYVNATGVPVLNLQYQYWQEKRKGKRKRKRRRDVEPLTIDKVIIHYTPLPANLVSPKQ